MVPSKLEQHVTKKRLERKDRPKDYFEKLRYNTQKTFFSFAFMPTGQNNKLKIWQTEIIAAGFNFSKF